MDADNKNYVVDELELDEEVAEDAEKTEEKAEEESKKKEEEDTTVEDAHLAQVKEIHEKDAKAVPEVAGETTHNENQQDSNEEELPELVNVDDDEEEATPMCPPNIQINTLDKLEGRTEEDEGEPNYDLLDSLFSFLD